MLQATWQANPVRIVSSALVIIHAGFVLAAAFGYALTPTEQSAVSAFLIVVGGEISRGQVTPNVNVTQPLPPSVKP